MDNIEIEGASAETFHADHNWRSRLARQAEKAEARFLTLLRYAALLIAALVLLGSVAFLAIGLVKQFGKTEVEPRDVALSAEDIAPPKAGPTVQNQAVAKVDAGVSPAIRAQTLKVYRAQFKRYERADSKVTDAQVSDFVWTGERIAAFESLAGILRDNEGKVLADREAVMRDALALTAAAAKADEFRKSLVAFRDAKQANVCTDEVKTRTRTVFGWNDYATDCVNWYTPPVGCAANREVPETYVEKVCKMKFPEDIVGPSQQLAAAVQRYADISNARITSARHDAEEQTARNHARKLSGHDNVGVGGMLFLGFLAVMFLYLFVAMERHHRALRALVTTPPNS